MPSAQNLAQSLEHKTGEIARSFDSLIKRFKLKFSQKEKAELIRIKYKLKGIAKKATVVPQNLKFAIIVAMGVFWADFLKNLTAATLSFLPISVSQTISSLLAAILATAAGLFVLESWGRIENFFR